MLAEPISYNNVFKQFFMYPRERLVHWPPFQVIDCPMSDQPALNVENSFLARARYPKGKKRLQKILDATYEIVISEGLAAASQEAIAKRAEVTQSAVRHYFPTKDELLIAFFYSGIERLQQRLQNVMTETSQDPRTQLLESASLHYDRVLEVEDAYFFEAAAFWGRNPEFRAVRDAWYQSLDRHSPS